MIARVLETHQLQAFRKPLESLRATLHNRLLKPKETLSSEIHATCPFFKTNTQKPFLSVFYTPRCQALWLNPTRAHTRTHAHTVTFTEVLIFKGRFYSTTSGLNVPALSNCFGKLRSLTKS